MLVRMGFSRFLAGLLLCALCAGARSGAIASERLQGTVLRLTPQHQVLVHHDPYGGMPAMTMLFSVSPDDAARLHASDRIEATVDDSFEPARLSGIHVLAAIPAPKPSVLQNAVLFQAGDALPDTHFVDQTGRSFTIADFRGKDVVLAFIYSRCRDAKMCPLISAHFKQLQDRLPASGYHLVEITLDPAYDTPAVLAAYGNLFGADAQHWTIGTGPVDDVLGFAARFGIVPFPDPSVGLIHSERTALIAKDGRILDLIDEAGWNPDWIVTRLRAADDLPSNPIARLDYELSKTAVAFCGSGVAGYSGLVDLAIVLAIFGGGGWLMYRLARRIFRAAA
jgi:protein SCO1/2